MTSTEQSAGTPVGGDLPPGYRRAVEERFSDDLWEGFPVDYPSQYVPQPGTGPQQAQESDQFDPAEDRITRLLGELLDTDDLDKIPSLQPLIADYLFMDSVGRINGPSGHGKSFVSLDMAGHIATGRPWHGRAAQKGTVVYLVAEGVRGIRKRVRAWEQHHGVKMHGVKFLPRPVQAMDAEWLDLIELLRRIRPVLVIIDTQARVTVGVEENSATEMGRVIHRMEELRAATGACVLLIHHKGLNGDHGRGSSAVKGAMQTELTVEKKGDSVTLATDKQKDSEEMGKLSFWLQQVALNSEAEEDGRPVTSAVLVLDEAAVDDDAPPVKLAPAARKLLETLLTLESPEPNKAVIDAFKVLHGHGLQRETASRELNELARVGLADRINATGTILWRASEAGRAHSP
ncbi:AAA family ATPase [Streptacidiphilus sp. N1-3]|uniref:AAA family ATPase n=1 Tax=Streptacidiphilus alkalitolerans TaxID=3342712 RepID=A0ABV6X7I2_9ACTN